MCGTCELRPWGFDHDEPSQFVHSQWQQKRTVHNLYLLFHLFWGAYLFSWLVITFVMMPSPTWFIYFTHWGFLLLNCSILCKCALMLRERNLVSNPSWCLEACSSSTALLITIVYWTLLYGREGDAHKRKQDERFAYLMDASNFHVHLLNTVYVLLANFLSAQPVKWRHFYLPLVPGFGYLVFNIVYFVSGGKGQNNSPYIYPFLDWGKLNTAIPTTIGITAMMTVLHMFLLGLTRFRKCLYRKYHTNRNFVVRQPT